MEFGEDWDHFAPVLANARERLPVLNDIGFEHYLRGPESFTPDANFHLGEFPEAPGLWIAAGFNSQGIIFSPGAGKALAEWIVAGHPTMDLTEVDIARTGRWANNRGWLHEKTSETLGRLYAMHWPALQPSSGRGVRRLPLEDRFRAAGAAFGEAAGWERPAWFEPGATDEPVWRYDFERPSWFGPVGEEMGAARDGVALFDLTTYSKFIVQGPGALSGLQWLCASDVDVPIGRVVYTLLCNDRGGIEMDPTVTRLAEQIFLVVAPTAYQRRTEALLRTGLPPDATVTDVTSAFAVLHLAGPRSRELLQRLTDADLSDDAFPFLSARRIEAGWAQPWALRVSYTGELGWELYVPTEFVADLYERVVEAGEDLDLRHAGGFAFDGLRLERGFRSWGHDMGPLDDPYEVGLGFAVRSGQGLRGVRGAPRTEGSFPRSPVAVGEAGRSGPDALARGVGAVGRRTRRTRDERRVRPHARQRGRARVGARRGVAGRTGHRRGPQPEGPGDDLLEAVLRPGGLTSSGWRWDLDDAPVSFAEVPDVDARRLHAERRQGGADLAPVVGPVVQRLREPDAHRGMRLGSVVPMSLENLVRIRTLRQERGPGVAVALHLCLKRGEVHVLFVDGLGAPTGRDEQVRAIGPTRCRIVSRIEP